MHVAFLLPECFWDCSLQEKMTLELLGSREDLDDTKFWLQESHRPEWAHASHPLRMPFCHSLTPCTAVARASTDKAAGEMWECAASVTEVRRVREHSMYSLSALDQGEPCLQKCCCALSFVAVCMQATAHLLALHRL